MDYQLERTKDAGDADYRVARSVFKACKSIDELIGRWVVDARRALTIGTGLDDAGEHTLVWIEMKIAGSAVAEAYLPLSEVRARYPGIRPITDSVLAVDEEEMHVVLCEEDFDLRDDRIGAQYNDALAERLMPREGLMELILPYAIANCSEVGIELMDEDVLGDAACDDPSLLERPIGWVNLSYHDPDSGQGFFESLYFEGLPCAR